MTKNQLRDRFEQYLIDEVDEIIHWEFDNFKDCDESKSWKINEVEEELHDGRLHQLIDQTQEVIYTHQAKEVCDVLDIDIFEDDPMTGERYTSWSHAAYSGLYEMMLEEIDWDEIINNAILKLDNFFEHHLI